MLANYQRRISLLHSQLFFLILIKFSIRAWQYYLINTSFNRISNNLLIYVVKRVVGNNNWPILRGRKF
jgi:hypothetical protein